ncbi:MAG TPA: hypothetical protein VK789_28325 [Bryobacteraceae bacterium]|nr:hypothetical protein [Bryobacteraceae bacterium]
MSNVIEIPNNDGKLTKAEFKEIMHEQIESLFETGKSDRMGLVSGLLALTFVQLETNPAIPTDEVQGCRNLAAALTIGQLKPERTEQLERALKVIALTPAIREHLERTDPMALRQVNRALDIPDPQRVQE